MSIGTAIRVIEESAGVVAAGNSGACAAVLPHNTAKIAAAGWARRSSRRNAEAAAVVAHDAAEIVTAPAEAEIDVIGAVCNAAAVISHNAADVAFAADAAAVGAVCNAAAIVLPHNAADVSTAADAAGEGAVCDGATVVLAHDAADVAVDSTADAAGNIEVFTMPALPRTAMMPTLLTGKFSLSMPTRLPLMVWPLPSKVPVKGTTGLCGA